MLYTCHCVVLWLVVLRWSVVTEKMSDDEFANEFDDADTAACLQSVDQYEVGDKSEPEADGHNSEQAIALDNPAVTAPANANTHSNIDTDENDEGERGMMRLLVKENQVATTTCSAFVSFAKSLSIKTRNLA